MGWAGAAPVPLGGCLWGGRGAAPVPLGRCQKEARDPSRDMGRTVLALSPEWLTSHQGSLRGHLLHFCQQPSGVHMQPVTHSVKHSGSLAGMPTRSSLFCHHQSRGLAWEVSEGQLPCGSSQAGPFPGSRSGRTQSSMRGKAAVGSVPKCPSQPRWRRCEGRGGRASAGT